MGICLRPMPETAVIQIRSSMQDRWDVFYEDYIELVKESMAFIRGFEGEMPSGKRKECDNYLDHNIPEARSVAVDLLDVLKDRKKEDLKYREAK